MIQDPTVNAMRNEENRIKRLRHSVKHALFERRNNSPVRYFCLEGQVTSDTRFLAASLWAWQQDPLFGQRNLIFSFDNLEKGKVWTLVVALFVHASVLHLFG